uniref:SAP domain-containing protein n=1 Tax=viral metagenome TaxID=1070528 RepID=A0A6C0K2X3_9ZZZZ
MMRDELMNVIDQNISKFLQHLAQSYPQAISMPQLQQSWQDFKSSTTSPAPGTNAVALSTPTTPAPTTPAPVSKKSGYQNFFTIRRVELKAVNPSLSFGELSKLISAEWNVLQPTEKSRFVNLSSASAPAPVSIPPATIPVPVFASAPAPRASSAPLTEKNGPFTLQDLNNKKMDELKDLCEARDLKKSGNKTELIRRLLGHNTDNKPSTATSSSNNALLLTKPASSALVNESSEKRDSSFDIYVSSKSEKRSDFEHSAITPEEEDFEFENLSDKFNSDSESTIQDDDDDDDDAFAITE